MHITAKIAVESPGPNMRRIEREDVAVSTTMRASGNLGVEMVIRNISTMGFMGEARGDFEPEARVRVRLPSLGTVMARIIWVRDGQFGAEFVNEIDLHRLRAVLAATGAVPPRRAAMSKLTDADEA